jgi:hypothetical protein
MNEARPRVDFRGPDFGGIDLSGTDLRGSQLYDANLSGADLSGADLSDANLERANLQRTNCHRVRAERANLARVTAEESVFNDAKLDQATLAQADFSWTYLFRTSLRNAQLGEAIFNGAHFGQADCSGADFTYADLRYSNFANANLQSANLSGCRVFGTSSWGLKLDHAMQSNLVISNDGEPTITVDNLEVAQFIYVLINNRNVRHVIDTVTSKVVLILGRFSDARKPILDAIRSQLRKRNYVPVLFDFDKPVHRDITETVSILAHMARFIIADITDARSIPQELDRIVPALPSVPVQPLLSSAQREYAMFEHFRRYPWVLLPFRYKDEEHLLAGLEQHVIGPAEAKAREQIPR